MSSLNDPRTENIFGHDARLMLVTALQGHTFYAELHIKLDRGWMPVIRLMPRTLIVGGERRATKRARRKLLKRYEQKLAVEQRYRAVQ